MTKQLTTQNATITTAAVEVKTLTIGGKQVTLAVFRQLREEPLIAEDGTLNGVPWGVVNYHPDKCSDAAAHWHIVWQYGQELRRSRVDEEPSFDQRSHRFRSMTTDVHAAYLLGEWAHGRVEWRPLVEDKLDPRSFREGYFCRWQTGGMSVEGLVQAYVPYDIIRDAKTTQARLQRQEKLTEEHPDEGMMKYLETCREDMKKAAAAIDAELAMLPPAVEVRAAYGAEIAAERSRRQRHRDARTTLAELPQLFIAV